jgi:hypothetical protein
VFTQENAKSQFTETEYVDIADDELLSSYPIGDDVSAFIRCVAAAGGLLGTHLATISHVWLL